MPNYERAPIEKILRQRRKAMDPTKQALADELLNDADLDVPMDAPERDTAMVLGDPNDERVVTAENGVEFTGRYGKRDTDAGPEGLTTNIMSEVSADDPRLQGGEPAHGAPEPTAPTRDSAAAMATFDWNAPQAWGGADEYNYFYEPGPDGKVGTITIEDRDGVKAYINPLAASGQTARQTTAWSAIVNERYKMKEAQPLWERSTKPARAETNGAEEPSSESQDATGLTADAAERDNAEEVAKWEGRYGDAAESQDAKKDEFGNYEESPPEDAPPSRKERRDAASEKAVAMHAEPAEPDGEYTPAPEDKEAWDAFEEKYGKQSHRRFGHERTYVDQGGRAYDAIHDADIPGRAAEYLRENMPDALEPAVAAASLRPDRVQARREGQREQSRDRAQARDEKYAGTPDIRNSPAETWGDAAAQVLAPYRDKEGEGEVLKRRAKSASESLQEEIDPLLGLQSWLLGDNESESI